MLPPSPSLWFEVGIIFLMLQPLDCNFFGYPSTNKWITWIKGQWFFSSYKKISSLNPKLSDSLCLQDWWSCTLSMSVEREREREREPFLPEKLEMLVWFILLLVCFDGYQGVWFFLDVATLVIIHKRKLAKFGYRSESKVGKSLRILLYFGDLL